MENIIAVLIREGKKIAELQEDYQWKAEDPTIQKILNGFYPTDFSPSQGQPGRSNALEAAKDLKLKVEFPIDKKIEEVLNKMSDKEREDYFESISNRIY